MQMKDEEKNLDVLQNIEPAVATTYKDDRDSTDYSVMSALEALIDSCRRNNRCTAVVQAVTGGTDSVRSSQGHVRMEARQRHLDEPLKELEVPVKTVEEIITLP
jgi:hypothetical protein